MLAAGTAGDRSRRVGPLRSGPRSPLAPAAFDGVGEDVGTGSPGLEEDAPEEGMTAVFRALHRMAQVGGTACGTGYVAREPTVLLSLLGAGQQLPHADASSARVPGDEPPMGGLFLALQDGTRTVVYPSLLEKDCVPGGPVVSPLCVELSSGSCFLFRGDLVHCGASNPFPEVHRRVHSYVHDSLLPTSRWSGQGHIVNPPTAVGRATGRRGKTGGALQGVGGGRGDIVLDGRMGAGHSP